MHRPSVCQSAPNDSGGSDLVAPLVRVHSLLEILGQWLHLQVQLSGDGVHLQRSQSVKTGRSNAVRTTTMPAAAATIKAATTTTIT